MNTKKNSIAGYQHITHTFGPVFDADSEILILGSLPSVQSRAQQFYYGHPQNRFWKVLAAIYQNPVPVSIEEKKAFLQKNHVALWDVIASCDIVGSSDSSIKNVKENDINVILKSAAIKAIYLNGGKAYELFIKYCKGTLQNMDLLESAEPMTMAAKNIPRSVQQPRIVKLPSTSPANAAWSLERLIHTWGAEILVAGTVQAGKWNCL